MTEATFIRKNEGDWKALEELNGRLLSTKKKLAAEEIREFARLFRVAGFHLAYAKTHFPSGAAVTYLNRIVGVAHNFFYVRELGSVSAVREYFARTLPRTVRETFNYWGAAMAVFLLAAAFAAAFIAGDTARAGDILPADMMAGWISPDGTPGLDPAELAQFRDDTFMTAFYMTNNTTVAFNSFAWGILGGLGTLYVLLLNGVYIGGFFGYMQAGGADMTLLFSQILPHGVLELFAIFIAGGGGLMIGKGLLIPGELTRRQSLINHTKKAVLLIPLIALMMTIAAFIEGFFSFTVHNSSPALGLAVAAVTFVGMVAYFLKGFFRENRAQ
jgi:uncharacterized membrane protein SpoIIM required for sporulation